MKDKRTVPPLVYDDLNVLAVILLRRFGGQVNFTPDEQKSIHRMASGQDQQPGVIAYKQHQAPYSVLSAELVSNDTVPGSLCE